MLAALALRAGVCGRAVAPSLASRWAPVAMLPSSVSGKRGLMTRRRRNELAHEKAVATRHVLEFAATFDPLRTARLELSQTLEWLGWAHNSSETVADNVKIDFSMKETFCAFCIVDAANLVPPGHPDASTMPAMPLLRRGRDGSILMPRSTPFPDAPAPWENPAQGLMLDKATAELHALIRSKGWELIAIPLPYWRAARAARRQHEARRDVVTGLTLPLAPFQPRPVALQAEAQSKAAKDDVRSGSSGGGDDLGAGTSGLAENNRGRIRSRSRREASESSAAGNAAAAAMKAAHQTTLRREKADAAAAVATAVQEVRAARGAGSTRRAA